MAEEKKPRKIILMGRSRVGKTTLLQAMHNEVIEYKKTQEIIVHDDAIDTPGEYIDQSGLWRACIIAACDADIVVLVHDAGNTMGRLPQMFSMTFAKPTIGVVTQIDGKTEEEIEIAENFLKMSGASKIVRTSAYNHEGIQELIDLIHCFAGNFSYIIHFDFAISQRTRLAACSDALLLESEPRRIPLGYKVCIE